MSKYLQLLKMSFLSVVCVFAWGSRWYSALFQMSVTFRSTSVWQLVSYMSCPSFSAFFRFFIWPMTWPAQWCESSTWLEWCCCSVTGTAACSSWCPCCKTSLPTAGCPRTRWWWVSVCTHDPSVLRSGAGHQATTPPFKSMQRQWFPFILLQINQSIHMLICRCDSKCHVTICHEM